MTRIAFYYKTDTVLKTYVRKEGYISLKYFKEYNNNPYGENIDDCVIRAISLFTHRDYYDVFDALCEYAGEDREPNQGNVFLPWLISQGYEVREFTEKITVSKFLNELNETEGVEDLDMLLLVNRHLTAIMGGVCYDTWDCGRYRAQLMIVKEGEI